MDATEQAIDQSTRIVLDGVEYALKISGAGAKNLLAALWDISTAKKKTKGKARLESLLKSGKELTVFNIAESDLEMFATEAKRYGVLYALIKDVEPQDGARVDIMVKAEDAAKLNRIVEKLEYAKVDVAEVIAEVQKEREDKAAEKTAGKPSPAAPDKTAAEAETTGATNQAPATPDAQNKGVAQKPDAAREADDQKTKPLQKETAAPLNPPAAKTDRPAPSEPTLNERGQSREASISNPPRQTNKTQQMGERSGGERRSVRAQLAEIKRQRTDNPADPAKPQQTRHQSPTPTRRSRKAKSKHQGER